MRRPLELADAVAYVEFWLRQPCVEIVARGEHHWATFSAALATGRGNLTSDAHIAALVLERGAGIWADHDFARFPGVTHVNPLIV